MVSQFYLIPPEVDISMVRHDLSKLRQSIQLHYLKGWFPIDLISILPYDLFTWLMERSIQSDGIGNIRMMRLVRLSRLAKVLRILRASRIIARYDDRVGLDFRMMRILSYVGIVVLSAHWMACLLRLVPQIENSEDNNWILFYFGTNDVLPIRVYSVALYWAVMIMSSVGFGDVLPQTEAEVITTLLAMTFGCFLFAFLLGSVTSLVCQLDLTEQEYYQLRDSLSQFMSTSDLSPEICRKLRHYFRNRYQQGMLFDWSDVLTKLSPVLQQEVAAEMQAQWIQSNAYFKGCCSTSLARLATVIVQRTFVKGEPLIVPGEKPHTLFMLRKGLVLNDALLSRAGDFVGEDMLYYAVREATTPKPVTLVQRNAHWGESPIERALKRLHQAWEEAYDERRQQQIRQAAQEVRSQRAVAICFVICNQLELHTLAEVLNSFPDLYKQVRKEVVRGLFRQNVFSYAQAYRKVAAEAAGPSIKSITSIDAGDTLVISKAWEPGNYTRNSGTGTFQLDGFLARFYTQKLMITQSYIPHTKKIIKIQAFARRNIYKSRWREITLVLRQDPELMQQKLLSTMNAIDQRLSQKIERRSEMTQHSIDERRVSGNLPQLTQPVCHASKCSCDCSSQLAAITQQLQQQQALLMQLLQAQSTNAHVAQAMPCTSASIAGIETTTPLTVLRPEEEPQITNLDA